MKIGILTFHAAFNYGSMLQAYALQTYLTQLGHQVQIINYRTKSQKRVYSRPLDFSYPRAILPKVKRLLLNPSAIKALTIKWELFDQFLQKYLYLTPEYNTFAQLNKTASNYDVIITGSDQIWNTNAFDFSEAYFATFANDTTQKIAYAPSMGPFPENQNITYLKKMLKGFNVVSVREKRTKDFLEQNGIAQNVKIVLDPTLLLDGNDYSNLYSPLPLIKHKYIFYYTPGGARAEFIRIADQIAQSLGLKIVCESAYYPHDIKQYKNIILFPEVGPSEFLNLVKNAEVVCGASFHLIVFSLLFRKNFYCVNGDVDSRMNNLMKMFHLEDRILSVASKKPFEYQEIKNYDEVSLLLEKYRSESKEFLNTIPV